MQHEVADKEVKFFKTTRYYRNVYEAYLKDDIQSIRDHANAIKLQEKTQDQSAQKDEVQKSQNDSKNNLKNKDNLLKKRARK
jgi:hypothetical protein